MSDRNALAAAREEELVVEQTEQKGAESAKEEEQKETEETKEEGTGDREPGTEGQTLTPALSHGEREQAAERIRQSEMLPVGLRTRLAELVLASDSVAAEQAIRAVEASLPGALRISAGEVARPGHPSGDVFFHGDADAMSEEQAEVLARGQLARSGMLRGQRVRVAE
jgi:hypothetical protein